MEPADLTPSSPEDARLEALLRDATRPLPDAGFSRQVVAMLPPRRKEKSWRALAYTVAASAVALTLLAPLVQREAGLADVVKTLADPMFAGAVIATTLSLLVAFRSELREKLFD